MNSKWTVVGALSLSSLALSQLGLANAQEAADERTLVQVAPIAEESKTEQEGNVWFQSAAVDDDQKDDAREFSADHWLYLLSDADLDERMRNFDRIIAIARHNPDALKWLQERASDTVDPELSWTAKLALREVQESGGAFFKFLPRPGGTIQLGPDRLHTQQHGLGLQQHQLDALRMLGQHGGAGSRSKSVQMQSGPDGVKVIVKEMVDGEEKVSEFEAESMELLLEANPELKDTIGSGAGGFRIGLSKDSGLDLDGLRLELDRSFEDLTPGGLRRIFRAIPRDLNFDLDPNHFNLRSPKGELRTDVLGVYIAQASPEQLEAVGRSQEGGIYVEAIAPGTLAEKLGIAAGDFLIAINGTALTNGDMIGELLRARAKGADLVVQGIGVDGREWTRTWSPPVQKDEPR